MENELTILYQVLSEPSPFKLDQTGLPRLFSSLIMVDLSAVAMEFISQSGLDQSNIRQDSVPVAASIRYLRSGLTIRSPREQ